MAGLNLQSQIDFYARNSSYKAFRATEIKIFSVNNIWKGNNSIQWIFIKFTILGLHLARPDFFFLKKLHYHSKIFLWLLAKKLRKSDETITRKVVAYRLIYWMENVIPLAIYPITPVKIQNLQQVNYGENCRLSDNKQINCFKGNLVFLHNINARTAKKQSGKNSRVIDTKSWFLCNFKDSAGHSRKNIIPGVCSTVLTLGLNGFKVHCLKNSLR